MKTPFVGGSFKVTSIFGMRTLDGKTAFHTGLDCVGLSSKDICAVAPGKVVASRIVTDKSNATWQWGNYVCVQGEDGKYVYYCHMSERKVTKGQTVKAGDVLGVMGNTGYSFGAHLHLEVREGSTAINTADYIGIKNETGEYTMTDEKETAPLEALLRLEALEKTVGENYHTIDDVPNWAKETIKKLINSGVLLGDENGDLKLSYQMIRLLLIIDRIISDKN